jgi:hypothetical protein
MKHKDGMPRTASEGVQRCNTNFSEDYIPYTTTDAAINASAHVEQGYKACVVKHVVHLPARSHFPATLFLTSKSDTPRLSRSYRVRDKSD